MIEFLRARIDEDEAKTRALLKRAQEVRRVLRSPKTLGLLVPGWHEWPDIEALAGRALRECKAKRQIVELHGNHLTVDGEPYWSPELRALAAVYEDHDDYDNRWRVL